MQEYNGAMMQYFHWYTPADGKLWSRLAVEAADLAAAGITSVWLPPAYKASGPQDVGYAVYDLFDLGEFDQKGSVPTKYGTRDDYLRAIQAAQAAGLRVYADIVLNHKMGGDHQEEFRATPYNPDNRKEAIGDLQKITAWTHFTFPGRAGQYSDMQWHWWHFKATDANARDPDAKAVYLFEGKQFHEEVCQEKGNFDYLMGCDLDVEHPEVQEELHRWGRWYLETTGVDGFRFDAVKHVKSSFFLEWLGHLRRHSGLELFAFGEYWSTVGDALKQFIEATDKQIMLFDAGLHYSFAAASRAGRDYDLRTILDNSLVKDHPDLAVTLVSNHDTQPLQALESVVEPWFKPLAYALILLRRGGYPCVFAADYEGAEYKGIGRDGKEHEITMPSHRWMIDLFLKARRTLAFGEQHDYFDEPHCIGWTRSGTPEHQGGLAVLLSNDADGFKRMQLPMPDAEYVDLTEHVAQPVVTDAEGWAEFRCQAGSVSVWAPSKPMP